MGARGSRGLRRPPPRRRGVSAPAALATLAVVAGCAAPPALPPPLSYPPAARERIVAFALHEWRDWGCAIVGLPGRPLAPCPAPRAGGGESAPENFPRVLAYWRAVPQAELAIGPNRRRYAQAIAGAAASPGAPALWEEPPWSAAFIAWVLGAAGVDHAEFRPDAAHVIALDHLDALAEAHPHLAPFLPRDPAVHAPGPGDLICADRSARPLAAWAERAAERGRFRPMHCDIVVATAPGVIEAVGGNLRDRVALRRLPADPAGRLLPGEPPWLVVMENRLGRTPPWEGTPAARLAGAGGRD